MSSLVSKGVVINYGEGVIMMFGKTVISVSVAGALFAVAGSAAASGFALIEQSGSGLGNAFAGGAASAEDASTIFFNPAGMSRLEGKQIVVAGNMIKPSAQFSDTGSASALGRPLGTVPGDAGSWALVPNAYFTMEISPKTRVGLGINAPFGLKTEYQAGWIGRFQALKSSVETININPSVSYQVSDSLTLGAGINYQQVRAGLTSAQNFVAGEGMSDMSGSDAAWGMNFGALLDMGDGGRLGFAYRSAINYQLSGTLRVTNPLGVAVVNRPVIANMKMPDTWSFSYFRALGNQWDVMADLTRTGWSNFTELRILDAVTGARLSLTPENWGSTWRAGIGSNYHYNEQWTARIGVAYDQAGVSDVYRTARIPDANRTWLALGGQYKPSKTSAIDFGYAHLFVSNATIRNNTGSAGTPSTATVGNLIGTYKNSVDILSAQYTYSF